MQFELTKEFLENLTDALARNDGAWIDEHVVPLHYADIAEIMDQLDSAEAKVMFTHLDEETQGDVLMELEEDVRDRFLKSLSSKEMADQLDWRLGRAEGFPSNWEGLAKARLFRHS